MSPIPGLLGLVGGDEFHPGNEDHDIAMVRAAGRGPAYIVATAASRQNPGAAVALATRWFEALGLAVTELHVRSRRDAESPERVREASEAGFLYLCGGDPGITATLLRGSLVGDAMVDAWRRGAVLAGSSAGAMVLCSDVLIREAFPGSDRRRPVPGLGVVPASAVLPHHDTFGERWVESARAALPTATLIGVDERACALWEAGHWRAMSGTVTVHLPGGSTGFSAGSEIDGAPQPQP